MSPEQPLTAANCSYCQLVISVSCVACGPAREHRDQSSVVVQEVWTGTVPAGERANSHTSTLNSAG